MEIVVASVGSMPIFSEEKKEPSTAPSPLIPIFCPIFARSDLGKLKFARERFLRSNNLQSFAAGIYEGVNSD